MMDPLSIDLQVSANLPASDREALLAGLRSIASVRSIEERALDPNWLIYLVTGVQLITAGAQLAVALIAWRREGRSKGTEPSVILKVHNTSLDLRTASDDEIRRCLSR
jgi:hypothetical protein